MPELWYDIANRHLLEYLSRGVMMRQALQALEESYADMIGRVMDYYDRKFDRRWPSVVRETCDLVGDVAGLQEVFDMFEPEYMLLREAEANLYQPLERNEGLVVCDELYEWHSDVEQDLHTRLIQLPGLTGKQENLLFATASDRATKHRQLRRQVRLAVDQGMFFIDDAERKAKRRNWEGVDQVADIGVWYLHVVLMPTPPSPH